jgi:transcriptional regulator with XRE-family HTH domain
MRPTPALRHLAATVRGRRQDLGLTQTAVAAQAGVSRQWLSGLESGKAGAEVGLVLRVLDVLDLRMDLRPADAQPSATDRRATDLDALLADYDADPGG